MASAIELSAMFKVTLGPSKQFADNKFTHLTFWPLLGSASTF